MYKLLTILLFLLLSVNAYGRGNVIGEDAFTTGSTVDLVTHAPNIGTAWTETVDTCTSNWNDNVAGYATPVTTDNCVMYYNITPSPDIVNYDIEFTVLDGGTMSAQDCRGVAFGTTVDQNNNYIVYVCDDANLAYGFNRNVSGVGTSLGTGGAFGNNQTDVITVKRRGDKFWVLENGALIIGPVTDTAFSGQTGTVGIFCGGFGATTVNDCDAAIRLDDFKLIRVPKRMIGE